MHYNLQKYLNKKADLNVDQIVIRQIVPLKRIMGKDMKFSYKTVEPDEKDKDGGLIVPDIWCCTLLTNNPQINFNFEFDTLEKAEECLRSFKEDR